MHDPTSQNLHWLDLLAVRVPAFGGYEHRESRRDADRILREAIADQFDGLLAQIDKTIRDLHTRDTQPGLQALRDIHRQVERIIQRLRGAPSEAEAFFRAQALTPAQADPIYAFDHALYDRAEAIIARFEHHGTAPQDFLADLEADLMEFDGLLDQRAQRLRQAVPVS